MRTLLFRSILSLPQRKSTLRMFFSTLVLLIFGGGVVAPLYAQEYSVEWDSSFDLPPQDANGFSLLTPSGDSLLIYVSEDGDDSSAKAYELGDSEIGSDPRNPTGQINAYKTISAAMRAARDNRDDWVMLKRGDSWTVTDTIFPKNGISSSRRSVITFYGQAAERPLILNGLGTRAVEWFYDNGSYSALIGLHFYSYTRDPGNSDFAGWKAMTSNNGTGFRVLTFDDPIKTALIEDNVFNFYANNTAQRTGKAEITDLIIRRNIITNNYSTEGHAQGLFTNDIDGFLVEENVFDHNGWYQQGDKDSNNKEFGKAVIFNHNTYFSGAKNLIMRNNIFMRASSMGNKFTANTGSEGDTIKSSNILLYNNFYLEGEVAISMGGNKDQDTGPRFRNIHIVNNVMVGIGKARPTNRSLGWGIEVEDWDGGAILNNVLKDWGGDGVENSWAIQQTGHTRDVQYRDNIIRNIQGGSTGAVVELFGANAARIVFSGNSITTEGSRATDLIEVDSTNAFSFSNNTYSSTKPSLFKIDDQDFGFTEGVATLGENGASNSQPTLVAADRDMASYFRSLGHGTTPDDFLAVFLNENSVNWTGLYTADKITSHIRKGLCLSTDPDCEGKQADAPPSIPSWNTPSISEQ